MSTVELSAGTIEYEDTSGSEPAIVFVHGVLMDNSVWRVVIRELAVDHRCVAPTLPLGAHLHHLRPGSDHSMRGIANLLVEFLERLDLNDVTLVVNDWGGPLLSVAERPKRINRLVITTCEAFDNVMPGIAGRAALVSAFLPGSFFVNAHLMRIKALRRMPFALGSLAKRPIADDVFDRWMGPGRNQSAVRRDLIKYLRGARGYRRDLLSATEQLAAFDRPALVVWAKEDRDMPLEHGRKIAALIPNGRLVEMADSYALIPLDQPVLLATLIRQFVAEPAARQLTAKPE